MSDNFPNLMETVIIQEAQRALNKLNTKRPTPRHIITKMASVRDKERILKAAKEKKKKKEKSINYKGTPLRLATNFSTETLQARGSSKT